MTAKLPRDARRVLELLKDEWAIQPAEYHPGAILSTLKAIGYAKAKRERPHPGSPFRYYLRRTNAGRAYLGLPPIEGLT